jgi:hypothetical protein
MFYRLLADLIVVVHLAYVGFVVVGLLVVLVGAWLRWLWVRNFWFRAGHLLAISIVVFESLLNIPCPLTEWENQLRDLANEEPQMDAGFGDAGGGDDDVTVEPSTFVERLVHAVMFYDCPQGVLPTAYCLFGLAVLATMFLVPPRRPRRRRAEF